MNKQIKWHRSHLEMYAATFHIGAFWAAYELCTFGWFSLKFSTLRCRQGSLPMILFLRYKQLHDPFMPSTTSNSLKRGKTNKQTKTPPVQIWVPVLCFAFYPCHTDDVEKQQGLIADSYWDLAVFLLRSSVFNLLVSRRKSERLWENLVC